MEQTDQTMRAEIDAFERELEPFERSLREPRTEYHERLLAHVRTLSTPANDCDPAEPRWAWLWSVCLRQEEQIANLQTRVAVLEEALEGTDD